MAGALTLFRNCAMHTGESAFATALSARPSASLSAVPPVTQPPQLNPTTASALEPLAIEDGDETAPVGDELAGLQGARRFRDAHAPHAQHEGEELVSHRKGRRVRAIRGHQQPTRHALLHEVEAIASRRLRELAHQ